MSSEQMAPETKGVTVQVLSTVDLGPEIEGMAGRQLRMRMVTFEPGGVFGPLHDHKDRPGMVYIIQAQGRRTKAMLLQSEPVHRTRGLEKWRAHRSTARAKVKMSGRFLK